MRAVRIAAIAAATVGLLISTNSVAGARAAGDGPPARPVVTRADAPWFESVTGAAVNVSGGYAPIVGQFDADQHDDIVWYAPGAATDQLWSGRGNISVPFSKHPLAQQVRGNYVPIAGNFGGDSHTDILWYGPGSQADTLWISNGDGTFTNHAVTIRGVYDNTVLHNSSPSYDSILWTIPDDGGPASLWQFSSSSAHISYTENVAGTPQKLVGDFDGNGLGDLFLYKPGSGADALWRRTSTSNGTFAKTAETVTGNYTALTQQFSPDDSTDHRTDILFETPGSGLAALWEGEANGSFTKSSHAVPLGGTPIALNKEWGYTLTTGTAKDDMIWYDESPHDINDTTGDPKVPSTAIPVVGGFNIAGMPSVLWYRPGSGAEYLFIPND
jgi:hypothetical protein